MFRNLMATLAVAALVAGCATTAEVAVPFNAAEVAYINQSGPAKVSGQGFTRLSNGAVITCAGTKAELVPAGQHAKERIAAIYGNVGGGTMSVSQPMPSISAPSEYATMRRTTVCDASGNFEFAGVANGDYYVMTVVQFVRGQGFAPEGNRLVRLVRVADGKSLRVVMN